VRCRGVGSHGLRELAGHRRCRTLGRCGAHNSHAHHPLLLATQSKRRLPARMPQPKFVGVVTTSRPAPLLVKQAPICVHWSAFCGTHPVPRQWVICGLWKHAVPHPNSTAAG
jgi:hypothetical protein